MWLELKRIIRSGFVGFWRNGFVSLASILVMTVTLFVVGAMIFIGAILDASLLQIKDKVDVNVYFLTSAEENEILALKNSLESMPEVEQVEYVSRIEALARFKERHADDQLTLQALQELDENPLGANLNIKARETSQYEGIAAFLASETALSSGETQIIDKVNYLQNKVAIERLSTIIDSSKTFGIVVTILLVAASIIITFNTIRLVIYTSRDEISVMRLVGASNMYIRGPFVFEGIMYGVIAALITLAVFYPLTLWLGPATGNFFIDINVFTYYTTNFTKIFFIIFGFGTSLGAVSSYLAVRRYLKA